jgi:hypothetical protein
MTAMSVSDVEYTTLKPRCVYVGKDVLPNVRILLVHEDIIKVIVIIDCREFYAFAYKSDAKEYIKRRFGLEQFKVEKCKS